MGTAVLTAETVAGRQAIAEVMQRSYVADVQAVPAAWARALMVDDVPVSFILVDPDRHMEYPGGDLGYAFICDVATREDRRGEGHFRHLLEHMFASLRGDGIPLMVLHGCYQLYRRFGFDVFTHHCGIFTTPDQIERALGIQAAEEATHLLVVDEGRYVQEGLLLVVDVKAKTISEGKAALQAAAMLARRCDKDHILFEHPAAPSYGSRYPIYPSLESPFTGLARACGAQILVQGADPESGSIPDADWIKVLDVASFLKAAVDGLCQEVSSLPAGRVYFDSDAGSATIVSEGGEVTVQDGVRSAGTCVAWPPSALAQLVTGYKSAEVLSTVHGTALSAGELALLDALFPRRWRFSRNESWTF